MEDQNICKFNLNRSGDLVCTGFVFETQITLEDQKDSYLLGLTVKGDGQAIVGDRKYPLKEGDLFLIDRDVRFCIDRMQEMEYCYILFSGRRADELTERVGKDGDITVYQVKDNLSDFWLDCLKRASDRENLDLYAEAVLLYSLAQLKVPGKAQNDLLTRILYLTEQRFTDPDFSLSDLAERIGYDAKYLSSVFRKKKGIAFTRYLRDLRVKRAIFLMEQGVVSVKNIALLTGFEDALYFSKIFKQCEGVSPKTYIENLQNR